jgi:hypothetical protein
MHAHVASVSGSATTFRRRGRRLVVPLLLALGLVLAASTAAFAAPQWSISSASNTTAAPGGTLDYWVMIQNSGDPTDGSEIDLVITLPPGMTAVSVGGFFSWGCTAGDGVSPVFGASVIKCTTTDVIEGPGSNPAAPIVKVAVDPSAAGTLTTRFQVSGGDPSNPSASTVDPTAITDTPPGFGVDAFDGQLTADPQGDPYTQAGGHPYALTTSIDFNTMENAQLATSPPYIPSFPTSDLWPVEATKDVAVDLPPGLVGDPSGVTQCTAGDLAHSIGFNPDPLCAPSSQVGTTVVRANLFFVGQSVGTIPVFNMVPPPGVPARFGFNVVGTVITFDASVRSDGNYGLSVTSHDVPEALAIAGTSLTFWGVPQDSRHDAERWCAEGIHSPCSAGTPQRAFLRLPTQCPPAGQGLQTGLEIDSWMHPGAFETASFTTHDPPGYPAAPSDWGPVDGPTGCDRVPFDPTFSATPIGAAQAGAPAGLHFDLRVPQTNDPGTIGQGDLKKAVVTLPAGMSVSPSSAGGLAACSPAQIGLLGTGFPEPSPIRFTSNEPTCPDASRLGTVKIDTSLLPEPLTGAIYLASPNDNPFGTLLSIYLVAEGSGVIVKLPGKIEANASTGQLTATFDDNPQLPFNELQLDFKGGPRAPLVMPDSCATQVTHAVLTSWSGQQAVASDSSFALPCVPHGFSPGFVAGTQNPVAGGDSPFALSVSRGDQDQQLRSIAVDLPGGLLGRISSTVLCPDAAANAGTCQDVSKVGSVAVAAGAGTNPFWITNGRAYITGPYKGAPFGLSIVVPAVAGPFDLGDVVVRAAIYVDRRTAALKVVSDPLPTILQGIPLDVREVRVQVDRPHFIVNPTNCAERRVYGTVSSVDGAVAHASNRFQVGECDRLPLAPKMTLTVGGRHHTRSGSSTPFTATLTQTPGQANLRAVTVTLPTTLNALLAVLNRACTQAQFDAGHCGGARAGSAVAVTPLLRDPLRGSAFFVRNPHRVLPDLVVALRGQVDIDLVGKVGVNPRTNQLTTKFDTIPDVSIRKFVLRLVAGANGPLGTTTNLCSARAKRATASIGFRAQNGKVLNVKQRLRILGCARRGRA